MKILIVGLGSIGTRHARLFKERPGAKVVVFRQKGRGNALGLGEITTWREAAAFGPDVAVICNPTSCHVATALRCARLGAHLFIEKPLSDRFNILALEALCRRKKLTCFVAYPLRFHALLQKAKEFLKGKRVLHGRVVASSYLPDWRPGRVTKECYFAKRKMGGGVLLELSHEFDYIAYLLGPIRSIKGTKGRAADITVDAEDFVDAIVRVDAGQAVNVHLNFMSRSNERYFHFDIEDGFIKGDLINNMLTINERGVTQQTNVSAERDDVLRAQRDHFLSHIGSRGLINGIAEAKPVLKRILEFRDARP